MNYSSIIVPLLPYAFRVVRRAPLPTTFRKWALGVLFELHDIYDQHGQWHRFVDSVDIRHLTFDDALSREGKKQLFKSSVRLVEFEPHAFCNRLCPFCPNVFLDRIKDHALMDIDTYRHAIGELAEIEFDQTVRFARYCEPLACKDICLYVSLARQALPEAKIDIITNGDYLNQGLLANLAEAGLSILNISIYPKGYEWDHDNAFDQLRKICKNAGLEAQLTIEETHTIQWDIPHSSIKISARASDFGRVGFDRGQALERLTDETYQRSSPCPFVFANFTVDFDRSVMPCCNLRGDMAEHKKYIVDRLDVGKSIFDIYCSKDLTEWRRSLVKVDRKDAPCKSCKQMTLESRISSHFLKKETNAKLRDLNWH
jgi:hypothetical protein